MKSLKVAHFLHLACQGAARTPAPSQLCHWLLESLKRSGKLCFHHLVVLEKFYMILIVIVRKYFVISSL